MVDEFDGVNKVDKSHKIIEVNETNEVCGVESPRTAWSTRSILPMRLPRSTRFPGSVNMTGFLRETRSASLTTSTRPVNKVNERSARC